jgi:hypothetical protein
VHSSPANIIGFAAGNYTAKAGVRVRRKRGFGSNSLKTHPKPAIKTMRDDIKPTTQFTLLFIIWSYRQSNNKTDLQNCETIDEIKKQ